MGRWSLSRRAVAVVTLALVAALFRTSPAFADDQIEIPVSSLPPIIINYPTGDNTIPINVELPGIPVGQAPQPVATQCTPIPGVPSNLCIGTPSADPQTPLQVGGLKDSAPLIKGGDKASSALAWMVPEALDAIRSTYNVPNDERVLRYARPQIRAYMVNRLLDIMDRKVFGVPLTPDEQKALDFLQDEYGDGDRILAQAAYKEYRLFEGTGGCGYKPPAPPANTPFKPLALPKTVADACNNAQPATASLFAFAPPIPSVDDFTTWGAYAEGQKLGLDAYANDEVNTNLSKTAIAAATIVGLATAVTAGFVFGMMVGASTAAATAVASLIGSSATSTTFVAGVGSVGPAAGAVGAGAAFGIVAVVIIFVIVTAISIWMVVQREAVGAELLKRVADAGGQEDALGLNALIPTYAGKELREGFTETNLPHYRSSEAMNKLMAKVVDWTTLTPVRTAIGDATTLWPDNETTDEDRSFLVRVGSGPVEERNSVTIPQKAGNATLRFSNDWMIIKQAGAAEVATLSIGYRDFDGVDRIAMRSPGAGGSWVIGGPDSTGKFQGELVDNISFKNANGQRVRVAIEPLPYQNLAGPRPSAVGPLYAARTVMLRPNPVNTNGSTIDYNGSVNDFSYDWAAQRFDLDTQAWVNVMTANDTYGTSFVPDEPGRYRATVTMTQNANPSNKTYGLVEFSITAPPVETPVLELIDNGSSQAELDLQVTQPVAGDTITTTVTWPDELGEEPADPTVIVQDCIQTDPLECTTQRTGPSNLLVHPLTSATDLRQPVQVTVSNSHGGTITRELWLDNPGRPTFQPPPDGVNDATPGSVAVDGSTAQVVIPLREDGNSNFQIAELVPGVTDPPNDPTQEGFALVDPVTGNTTATIALPDSGGLYATVDDNELWIFGHPSVRDLGSYEVPIVISQTNTNRNLFTVGVHIVASTEDRFRGGLQSDIDPNAFTRPELPELYPAVFGGRAEWAPYDGNVCVGVEWVSGGPPVLRSVCGPLEFFYGDDGQVQPFPLAQLYPEGMNAGTYRSYGWLADAGEHVDTTRLKETFGLSQVIDYPAPDLLVAASVDGTPQVGATLSADVPTFPATATKTYQWLRDGSPISDADSASYKTVAADRGHRLSVRVRTTAAGYAPTTDISALTFKVAPGILTKTPVPTIIGRADVGQRLTAVPGKWNAGVTFTYKWFANGNKIVGATGKRLLLKPGMKGKRITVKVTGKKPGYKAVTKTSKPTARV